MLFTDDETMEVENYEQETPKDYSMIRVIKLLPFETQWPMETEEAGEDDRLLSDTLMHLPQPLDTRMDPTTDQPVLLEKPAYPHLPGTSMDQPLDQQEEPHEPHSTSPTPSQDSGVEVGSQLVTANDLETYHEETLN